MVATGGDDRQPVAADMYGFRPLDDRPYPEIAAEVIPVMKEAGARWFRVTAIWAEHPQPPYPFGWYFEGWLTPPHAMPAPSREAPFAFPMTEVTP